jgi:hypothetical protein
MIIERPSAGATSSTRPRVATPRPCAPSGASPGPIWTTPLPSLSVQRALPSGPSPASTMTACSAAGRRAGGPTCPRPAPSRSSRCCGSRSWSCLAACPRAARQSSLRTAPCRTAQSIALRYHAAAAPPARRQSLRTSGRRRPNQPRRPESWPRKAVSRALLAEILRRIDRLKPRPPLPA